MHEGQVDDAFLDALLDDLGACEILEVLTRGAPGERGQGGHRDARGAVEALRVGVIRGVQIRYRYSGTEWWDTLSPTPDGAWRIVRIEQTWTDR